MDYPWNQREEFFTALRAVRGSTDLESIRHPNAGCGRSPRSNSEHPEELPVTTIDVVVMSSVGGPYGFKLLGAPFGTLEERDELYHLLAEAGADFNDANASERARAKEVREEFKK